MMTITLNGKPHELDTPLTIAALIQTLSYGERKLAVAVNQTFVPRGDHATIVLNEGDDVEIVAPMPGG